MLLKLGPKPNCIKPVSFPFSTKKNKKIAVFDIDETLLHCTGQIQDITHTNAKHIVDVMLPMKKQVKIKKLCFSYHDAAQNIIPVIEQADWDFAQIQFNYLDYDMQDAKKQYEILTENNISVIVMEPVRGGLLANVCDEAKDLFKSARPDMSVASWALRYCAKFSNIKVILSGMSNMEQLQDNINTFTNYEELNEKEIETLNKAKNAILGNKFIPCTACKYCMPCPKGINIPRTFAVYNVYGINKDLGRFKKVMENNGVALDACVKCGACVEQCPQKIDIPARLEEISKI